MDYRERKYYLIRLYDHNNDLKKLKEKVPSLKVHPPYNHFNLRKPLISYIKNNEITETRIYHHSHKNVYDGCVIENFVHMMVSCKKNEATKFIDVFVILSKDHEDMTFIMELEKWDCRQ